MYITSQGISSDSDFIVGFSPGLSVFHTVLCSFSVCMHVFATHVEKRLPEPADVQWVEICLLKREPDKC